MSEKVSGVTKFYAKRQEIKTIMILKSATEHIQENGNLFNG
jgi:hypothetical protein